MAGSRSEVRIVLEFGLSRVLHFLVVSSTGGDVAASTFQNVIRRNVEQPAVV